MDNVASVDKIMVSAGTFIPCVRILRGIDIASRQKGATYTLNLSFSYPVAGVVVTTPVATPLVSATKPMAGADPVWGFYEAPAIPVAHAPDAGVNITCNVKITIKAPGSGVVFDTGYLDTVTLPQAPSGW